MGHLGSDVCTTPFCLVLSGIVLPNLEGYVEQVSQEAAVHLADRFVQLLPVATRVPLSLQTHPYPLFSQVLRCIVLYDFTIAL